MAKKKLADHTHRAVKAQNTPAHSITILLFYRWEQEWNVQYEPEKWRHTRITWFTQFNRLTRKRVGPLLTVDVTWGSGEANMSFSPRCPLFWGMENKNRHQHFPKIWPSDKSEGSREGRMGGRGALPHRSFITMKEPTAIPAARLIPRNSPFLNRSWDLLLSAAASCPKSSAKRSWEAEKGDSPG